MPASWDIGFCSSSAAIVWYSRGASDGEGEGLRDSPDASKHVRADEELRGSADA